MQFVLALQCQLQPTPLWIGCLSNDEDDCLLAIVIWWGKKIKSSTLKRPPFTFSRLERPLLGGPKRRSWSWREHVACHAPQGVRFLGHCRFRRDLQLSQISLFLGWFVEGPCRWRAGLRGRDHAAGGARSGDPVWPSRARPLPAGSRWRSRTVSFYVVEPAFFSLGGLGRTAQVDLPRIGIASWPWVHPCCLKTFLNRSQHRSVNFF